MLAAVQVDSIAKEVNKHGNGYKYMDTLPVNMLGLVDDIIGVTVADHSAQQLNTILGVKTAEKQLQFGARKCKIMLIGKNEHLKSQVRIGDTLTVDDWTVKHEHDKNTNETNLIETYNGQVKIEHADTHKYLGFVLSSKGDNLVNINAMKRKSIWIIRKIFLRLESLHLQKYYFECGLIFLNVFLRSSILYASETYYNLKESQIRQLERIEEGYLRKLFQTGKGCPIVQLYLEAGHVPARFAIKKARLLFLKSILEENPESLIQRFVILQFKNPTKDNWASSCIEDLKEFGLNLSIEEILKLKKQQF